MKFLTGLISTIVLAILVAFVLFKQKPKESERFAKNLKKDLKKLPRHYTWNSKKAKKQTQRLIKQGRKRVQKARRH